MLRMWYDYINTLDLSNDPHDSLLIFVLEMGRSLWSLIIFIIFLIFFSFKGGNGF